MLRARRKFHISIEKDEAGLYVGRCKELPNAFTQAKSLPKLKQRMAEVISLIIEEIEEVRYSWRDKLRSTSKRRWTRNSYHWLTMPLRKMRSY